jgi:hypothetical protein
MSNEFKNYCDKKGIVRRHTVRNRPQQNGTAENGNKIIGERITAMLSEANLPMQFWVEALLALIHVWNRCPTSALKGKTPYELWLKLKPDVSHLRVWGCLAYVHIQKDKRKGFSPRMEKGIFIGYPDGYKGWKFYIPSTKKAVISERADFDERYFPGLKKDSLAALPNNYYPPAPPQIVQMPELGGDDVPPNAHAEPIVPAPAPVPIPEVQNEEDIDIPDIPDPNPDPLVAPPQPVPEQVPNLPRRSNRPRNPPGEWWKIRHPPPQIDDSDDELGFTVIDVDPDLESEEFAGISAGTDPRTYKQAMNSPDMLHWKKAMLEEINALLQNGTWEIVRLPEGEKAIGSGWVFKIKRNADGSIERYKGRFVAKGFSQRPGLDFTEVFAPTVRMATVRLILAIAAIEGLHLRSVDISNAFLKGDLEEEIYMKQPEGFHELGPEYVLRLKKAIYGLKQAARQWNKKLHATLVSMGFKRLESDRSVYIYERDGVKVIIPIFVDDITLASKSQKALDETVEELAKHFPLRDLGPTSFLLGIHITRDFEKRTVSLSQRQYIIDMLDRFGFGTCSPVSTPMDPGLRLTPEMGATSDEDKAFMLTIPYLSAVGALMYLGLTSRPDISNAVGILSRFSANPGPTHWKAVKHLFRYLQGTKDLRLVYGPDNSGQLFNTYTDAAHGDVKENGRSTGGYLVKFGSGAVSWNSKVQPFVALSTSEAEFIAAVEAGKEIFWMRNILKEFGYKIDGPSLLHCDNQSAIQVAKNPEHHGRMKHLDLRFFWLRDAVENGAITVSYLPTGEMPADALTKPLSRQKVVEGRKMMGLDG